MSGGDGAHMGVSANRALKTILSGEDQPTEEEQMDPVQMRDWILQPDIDYGDDMGEGYGEVARRIARTILTYYMADPRRATIPTESEYDWEADPDHGAHGMKPEFVKHLGLYDIMKQEGVPFEPGFTGFQWGWAVNAARRCVELPPVPNPAFL